MTAAEIRLTIGQLARRAGVASSTLRFYESEGLLAPDGRSAAGYRLYRPAALQTVRFIRRAQRLGFSLADIARLLAGWHQNDLDHEALQSVAVARYLELEKAITDLLILRRELNRFLANIRHDGPADVHGPDHPASLHLEQLQGPAMVPPLPPVAQPPAGSVLASLARLTGCNLAARVRPDHLTALREVPLQIWQDGAAYRVFLASQEPAVGSALEAIAALEADCDIHERPELSLVDGGYLYTAAGPHAFIMARFFLALAENPT